MKKIQVLSLIVFLSAYSGNVPAQESPWRFGINAGGNFSNMTYDNPRTDDKFGLGYQFGVIAEYHLPKNFFIQSGLSFANKRTEYKNYHAGFVVGGDGKSGDKMIFNRQYLQIPLNAGYKVSLSKDVKLLVTAGPYVAYGIGGTSSWKLNNSVFGDGSKKKERDTFSNEGLSRWDYGINAGTHIEYKKIRLGLTYEWGLKDISKGYGNGLKHKNQTFLISVAYMF